MKKCPYCSQSIAAESLACQYCGQPQLPANRLNLVLSVSLVGVALLVALAYWLLSEVLWLPLTQTGFYLAIDAFGLQNYVPYWTGAIELRSFLNANWLLFGALIYIPLITIMLMRLGLQRAAIVAAGAPLPFAIMDIWSWWVRSVAIHVETNEAAQPPGVLQFILVLIIAGSAIALAHFAITGLAGILLKRYPAAALIQIRPIKPIVGDPAGLAVAPDLVAPHTAAANVAASDLPGDQPALPAPLIAPVGGTLTATPRVDALSSSVPSVHPIPSVPIVPSAPFISPISDIATPPPPAREAGDHLNGLPAWGLVAALAILLILGFILIIFATRI